jgi:hypothetical protein
MSTPAVPVNEPLRLGEVLGQAIQLYGRRALAYVAVGTLQSGAFLIGLVVPWYAQLVVLAAAFVVSFALIVRLAVGDSFGGALRRLGRDWVVLLPLTLVVAVPFVIGGFSPVFLIVSILWLGLTSFAVPSVLLDDAPYAGPLDRPGRRFATALRRTVALAQADVMHSVGVALVLVLIDLLVGIVLAITLFSFADQGKVAAPAIAQAILSPFLFLGLTVLYFEQLVRAREGRRPAARR